MRGHAINDMTYNAVITAAPFSLVSDASRRQRTNERTTERVYLLLCGRRRAVYFDAGAS